MPMDYHSLLNAIIDDGQDEIRRSYTRPDQQAKRDGALKGFEACRGKTNEELTTLLEESRATTRKAQSKAMKGDAAEYWRVRYYELQVEWVCNVLSYALQSQGLPVIITPTARGALKAADILGTKKLNQGQP